MKREIAGLNLVDGEILLAIGQPFHDARALHLAGSGLDPKIERRIQRNDAFILHALELHVDVVQLRRVTEVGDRGVLVSVLGRRTTVKFRPNTGGEY